MSTWYSKELGLATNAIEQCVEIFKSVKVYELAGGWPAHAAVLTQYNFDTDSIVAYFTPEAVMFAEQLGAKPCEMPAQDGQLGFLAGDQAGFEFYYGGAQRR